MTEQRRRLIEIFTGLDRAYGQTESRSKNENGKLESKWNYKDGKKEGENIHYWKNGKLWVKENYKDGKKEGVTLVYNKNGKFEKTKIYKAGKLIETITP